MNSVCHKCGQEILFDGAVFCPHCGRKLLAGEDKASSTPIRICMIDNIEKPFSDSAESSKPTVPMPNSEQSEPKNICPICCTAVSENDEAITCPDCNIKYHKDCWEDNNGCATYGCPSTGCLAPPPPKITSSECETDSLHDDANLVDWDGIICPYCQTKLLKGVKFCWKCGKDLPTHQEVIINTPVSTPEEQSPSEHCSFGKKVLAGVACAGFFVIVFMIYLLFFDNSKNNRSSDSHPPLWVTILIMSGCSGIWKSITGEK